MENHIQLRGCPVWLVDRYLSLRVIAQIKCYTLIVSFAQSLSVVHPL